MSYQKDEIRQIVRRVVLRTLRDTQGISLSRDEGSRRAVITAEEVNQAQPGAPMKVPSEALITPLAQQVAMERGITLTPSASDASAFPGPPTAGSAAGAGQPAPAQGQVVAIGCDHGGFELKEDLKAYLAELGYRPLDCGTHNKEAVDYPDLAFAVARQVADGNAFRGIVIDGAGIGSCMAANKVPGVRAALCYDQATAVNSREHNDANVLTLGAGLIGRNLARQIVQTWLKTDFGGGRHAGRVAKIMGIEQRYLKSR
jgi:ribose 5-phosphate isomerase B